MLASARGLLWTLAAVAVAACTGGCVERQMTIRSDPPGALVYVDNNEIGLTPVSTPFTYYGQREIRLAKDGCETLTVIQPVPPPWYEIPGLDFIPETLVPGKIRDERTFDYPLQPQMLTPPDQLRDRAESLRHGVQASAIVPAPTTAPGMRINPPPEVVPAPMPAGAPAGIGGRTVYPVQPGGQ
jgi:hypothetical protein